jgi:hypothetical protein
MIDKEDKKRFKVGHSIFHFPPRGSALERITLRMRGTPKLKFILMRSCEMCVWERQCVCVSLYTYTILAGHQNIWQIYSSFVLSFFLFLHTYEMQSENKIDQSVLTSSSHSHFVRKKFFYLHFVLVNTLSKSVLFLKLLIEQCHEF